MKTILNKFKGSTSDIILIFILGYLAYAYHRSFDKSDVIGACLIIFSVTTWLVARYQLGDAFSVLPQSKTLVTKGIYSKIRHPIYFSSILAVFGLCLMYKEAWPYLILFALIILQTFRAKAEEKVLSQKFNGEFFAYKKSTWF